MELYTLTGLHESCKGKGSKEYIDNPSKVRLNKSPFSLLYLVSKDKERAQHFAETIYNHTNDLLDFYKPQFQNIELSVKPLSIKGQIRFLMGRYIFGNLIFLGESSDLDTREKKLRNFISKSPYRNLISRI